MKKVKMSWKESLAKMGIVPKTAKMIFEIDGANGEKLVFPEANDITEIKEESVITAEDGEHIFVADGKTYKIEVLAGKVTKIEITEEEVPAEMSAEFKEVLQAFANEFEANAIEKAEMKVTISTLEKSIAEMKTLMFHKKDDDKKELSIGGKKINFDNLNKK